MKPYSISVSDENILESFKNILTAFFNLFPKDKIAPEIILRRYGINLDRKFTLAEIGISHNLTRERIRQIQNSTIRDIKALLDGNTLRHPRCHLDKIVISRFQNFVKRFSKEQLIHENKINRFLNLNSSDLKIRSYIKLLFDVHNIHKVKYRYGNLYERTTNLAPKVISKIIDHLLKILVNEPEGTSKDDLTIRLKKQFRTHKLTHDIIEKLIEEIPELEGDSDNVRIRFEYLRRMENKAFIILSEEKKQLHYMELARMINKLMLYKAKPIIPKALAARLCNDNHQRFIPTGRSGFWGLKGWDINTDPLIQLLMRAFDSYDKPCKPKEILSFVRQSLPKVHINSITSLLVFYKKQFKKIDRGTYILQEWKDRYPVIIKSKQNRKRNTKERYRSFIKSFIEDCNRAVEFTELLHAITSNFKITEASAKNIISREMRYRFLIRMNSAHTQNKLIQLNREQVNADEPIHKKK